MDAGRRLVHDDSSAVVFAGGSTSSYGCSPLPTGVSVEDGTVASQDLPRTRYKVKRVKILISGDDPLRHSMHLADTKLDSLSALITMPVQLRGSKMRL